MTAGPAAEALARHRIANLLHTYVEIADRKDVDAAVELLGTARIVFPADASDEPAAARRLFGRLWSSPVRHRHDVSTLVVVAGEEPGTWTARAHYTRWVLDPAPVLHTLGEYTLVVAADWRALALTVTRTWTAAP
ncbi:hypothetical protein GCM10009836_68100 [Pseudonocardia ailaonensis]|uniref:SnoaL-like domain-containing protein n=1 Tax=Pseudonocardia ailaonensis TaxID=367279 RepID=A0ABN2NSF7_9PSEU